MKSEVLVRYLCSLPLSSFLKERRESSITSGRKKKCSSEGIREQVFVILFSFDFKQACITQT